jgi:hypothetical protein
MIHNLQYWDVLVKKIIEYPNVVDLYRGKTSQSASDVAAHSLGQAEAYFIVRDVLAEASTAVDGVLWHEHSVFGRWRFATLGYPTLWFSSPQRAE